MAATYKGKFGNLIVCVCVLLTTGVTQILRCRVTNLLFCNVKSKL